MKFLSSLLFAILIIHSCKPQSEKILEFKNQKYLDSEIYRLEVKWSKLMKTSHTMNNVRKCYSLVRDIHVSFENLKISIDKPTLTLNKERLTNHLQLLKQSNVLSDEEQHSIESEIFNLKVDDQINILSIIQIRIFSELYANQLEPNYQIDSLILKIEGPKIVSSGSPFEGSLTPIAFQSFWQPALIIGVDSFSSQSPSIPFTVNDYHKGKNEIEGLYFPNHFNNKPVPFKFTFEVQ